MANSQSVTTTQQNPLAILSGMLEKHKNQIAMALPRHMTPERMIRVALTAASNNPMLAKCTPVSIASSIVQSSILGLEPSSVLGESYLVPFWNTKAGHYECQLMPGYQGLVKLARNSGEVSVIDAQIVYSNDQFEFHKGSEVFWMHKWARSGDRGTPEGVWAGYVLKDGSKNFEYWTWDQIERHRDQYSKGAYKMERGKFVLDSDGNKILTGAWADSPEWMFKKTVLKQVIKLMPKSVELATALTLSELADTALPQNLDVLPMDVTMIPEGSSEAAPSDGTPKRQSESGAAVISEAQSKRMYAMAKAANLDDESIDAFLAQYGFNGTRSVTKDKYDEMCARLEKMKEAA